MDGREAKVAIVRAGLHIYQVAGVAGIHPVKLSRILNNHEPLTARDRERINAAIARLSERSGAGF